MTDNERAQLARERDFALKQLADIAHCLSYGSTYERAIKEVKEILARRMQ